MMKIFKRDLALCAAITVFVILCALAWGTPFVGIASHAALASSHQSKATVFQGAVVHQGAQFVLRDSSGVTFQLENPQSAESFEGKTVVISGRLEPKSKTIHIEHIEPAA